MFLIVPIMIISGCGGKPPDSSSEILPAHTIASRVSLGNNSERIQIDSSDPQLSREDCSKIANKYQPSAGQVSVHKPNPKPPYNGKMLPFCVNNVDGKGVSFNDYFFTESNTPQIPAPSKDKPINVTLDVKANQTNKKQLTVKGKTNLPDGFIITVGVCRYHFEKEDNSKRCLTTNSVNPSSQKVPVSKGQFTATFTVPTVAELKSELIQYSQTFQDPLAAKHLPEEFITVSVIGTPLTQSPEILKVIGKDGENLQGKQTVRKSFVTVEAEAKVKM